MKTTFFLILITVLIVIPETTILSQDVQIVPQQKTQSERSAEGQTKLMMSQLGFEKAQFNEIYKINLTYRLAVDSIHQSEKSYAAKREAYLAYGLRRNEELRKTLSPQQYSQHIAIEESIKAKAPLKVK